MGVDLGDGLANFRARPAIDLSGNGRTLKLQLLDMRVGHWEVEFRDHEARPVRNQSHLVGNIIGLEELSQSSRIDSSYSICQKIFNENVPTMTISKLVSVAGMLGFLAPPPEKNLISPWVRPLLEDCLRIFTPFESIFINLLYLSHGASNYYLI